MNVSNESILLEICTASVEDCVAAEVGGADRVELNTALMLGGLTPSLGTFEEAMARIEIPIIAMIRPRAGGFCYSTSDFLVMQRDVEMMLDHGATGIAFGILHEDGQVDMKRCRLLLEQCSTHDIVFHRAFDVVPDPFLALDQLIDLGITRVMTSGQEASAYNGAENIARFIDYAAGRIEILPAGGINRFTIHDVLERTGCDQVHASLSVKESDGSTRQRPHVSFGGTLRPSEIHYSVTDQASVVDMRKALGGAR